MAAHLQPELVRRVIIAIVGPRYALLTSEVLTGRKFIRLNDIGGDQRAITLGIAILSMFL